MPCWEPVIGLRIAADSTGCLADRMHSSNTRKITMPSPPFGTRLSRVLLLLTFMCALAGSAFADTCDIFATLNCAKGDPDVARLGGGIASGQDVGFVLKG